ncbi:MAG: histidinol-phosphatase [Candidatus Latescibacteria bacterium]|nr:histidinol-phosphatase [Candidatus Latescibacterota bacterium]
MSKPYVEVQGVLHVHSNHSDGSGSVAAVVEAAQRTGVDFLVLTDHNTMRAKHEGWEGWHGSTLLIVGEEVSTRAGHCLAIGTSDSIPRRRPAAEIIRDIGAQGGLSFIAHPHGVYKPFLRRRDHSWKDWSLKAYTGLEIWSYMFDWARQFKYYRWSECVRHPDRLIVGPDPHTLSRWDELGRGARVVGIGGVDAHARRYPLLNVVIFPYEDLFRTVRTHVLLDGPLTRDAATDRVAILNALREGRCFASYDHRVPGLGFCFSAPSHGLLMGDEAAFLHDLDLVVESPVPAAFRLIRDGLQQGEGAGRRHVFRTEGPGVYRAEARLDGRPWIFTNPIYLR